MIAFTYRAIETGYALILGPDDCRWMVLQKAGDATGMVRMVVGQQDGGEFQVPLVQDGQNRTMIPRVDHHLGNAEQPPQLRRPATQAKPVLHRNQWCISRMTHTIELAFLEVGIAGFAERLS